MKTSTLNKSNIFKTAWIVFRQRKTLTFSECLKLSWSVALISAKNASKNAKRKAKKFQERKELKNTELKPLWGNGAKYSTQAEYQRAGLGSKWN